MTHKELVLMWGVIALLAFALVLAFEGWFYSRVKRRRAAPPREVDHHTVHIIEQVRLPVDWETENWIDDEPVLHDWREEGWA